eukprot:RCo010894
MKQDQLPAPSCSAPVGSGHGQVPGDTPAPSATSPPTSPAPCGPTSGGSPPSGSGSEDEPPPPQPSRRHPREHLSSSTEASPFPSSGPVTLTFSLKEDLEAVPGVLLREHRLPLEPLACHHPDHRYTVVLDLDNTLVSTAVVEAETGVVAVTVRPFLLNLLKFALSHCDVFVWTAGSRAYAVRVLHHVLQHLRLGAGMLPWVITRDDEGWYTQMDTSKDIRLLGRDVNTVVLIEDSQEYARLSSDNAVIVPRFTWDLPPSRPRTPPQAPLPGTPPHPHHTRGP